MPYPSLAFLGLLVAFYFLLGGALLIDALRRAARARSHGVAQVSQSASTGATASPVSAATSRRSLGTDLV